MLIILRKLLSLIFSAKLMPSIPSSLLFFFNLFAHCGKKQNQYSPTICTKEDDVNFYPLANLGQKDFEAIFKGSEFELEFKSQFDKYLEEEKRYSYYFDGIQKTNSFFPVNPYFILEDKRPLGETKGRAIHVSNLSDLHAYAKAFIKKNLNRKKEIKKISYFFDFIKNTLETRFLIQNHISKIFNLNPDSCDAQTCQKINLAVATVDSCIFAFLNLYRSNSFYAITKSKYKNTNFATSLYLEALIALLKIYLFYKPIEGLTTNDFSIENELNIIYCISSKKYTLSEKFHFIFENKEKDWIPKTSPITSENDFKELIFNCLDFLDIKKDWDKDNILTQMINHNQP